MPDTLTATDGWITSSIAVQKYTEAMDVITDTYLIDCPEPPSAYPQEIITVNKGFVSKKDMQKALAAAGQNTDGQFINKRGEAFYTGNWNQKADTDISKEEAARQAIYIGLKYFAALGVEVNPVPASIERPYDYDAYIATQTTFYEHSFSDSSTFIERAKTQWKRRSKYNPEQSEYTRVTFSLTLDGMTLARNPCYPASYLDEPEAWEGFNSEAHVIVSDSGILVEASCTLLEIASRRPLENDPVYDAFLTQYTKQTEGLAQGDCWQDALRTALQNISVAGQQADMPFQSKALDKPITAYGSQTVITDIAPILYTISRDEWAPFWQIKTEQEYSDGYRL